MPFSKPSGSWQFEYSWRWTGRSIGFDDTEKTVRTFLEEASRDLTDRFAVALEAELAELAAAPPSPIRSAWPLPRERALVDIPAGAARPAPGGVALVRTRGQQIHAFGPDPERLWAAGEVRWPERKDDPLAYPAFTHVPPLVRADGSVVHAVVDPDPPHVAWLVEVHARGKEARSTQLEGVPCSGVAEAGPSGLALAVWRPGEDAEEGGRFHLLRLSPEGKEVGAVDTGWTASAPATIELVAGPGGAALAITSGRMVLLDGAGAATWRVESAGIEPWRYRVLQSGGELLRVDGGRVVAGGPDGPAVVEVDGTLEWLRPGEGDRILAGGGNVVYAFSRQGGLFWRRELAEEVEIPPLADGGLVYLGSWKRLWALRAGDGEIDWETPLRGHGCRWPPVAVGEGESRAILVLGAVRSYLDPMGRR